MTSVEHVVEKNIYELNGEYYQVLGHAWDHEVKEFKVVYRPLYHCTAKKTRFPAHNLAVSHFSRWEEKFNRVTTKEEFDKIPKNVHQLILPGPFTLDPEWKGAKETIVRSEKDKEKHPEIPGNRTHEEHGTEV